MDYHGCFFKFHNVKQNLILKFQFYFTTRKVKLFNYNENQNFLLHYYILSCMNFSNKSTKISKSKHKIYPIKNSYYSNSTDYLFNFAKAL